MRASRSTRSMAPESARPRRRKSGRCRSKSAFPAARPGRLSSPPRQRSKVQTARVFPSASCRPAVGDGSWRAGRHASSVPLLDRVQGSARGRSNWLAPSGNAVRREPASLRREHGRGRRLSPSHLRASRHPPGTRARNEVARRAGTTRTTVCRVGPGCPSHPAR